MGAQFKKKRKRKVATTAIMPSFSNMMLNLDFPASKFSIHFRPLA